MGPTQTCKQPSCARCGYENTADADTCGLCGDLLSGPVHLAPPVYLPEDLDDGAELASERIFGLPEHWFYPLVGAALAPVLALTPLLQYMGWFLGSLCHEMGHSTVAMFCGMPAYPAIRIDGHAASIHQPQVLVIALAVWAGLGWLAWYCRHSRPAMVALALCTLAYPALAFTDAKELLHLLGGHLGELAFATVFLWRALSGGFTHNPAERALYGMVGWYLVGRNVWLCGGLVFSPHVRAWYHGSGSFGLTNDYIRIAEDVLRIPLPTIAAGMLLVALVAPVVAWSIWRLRS